MTEQPVQERENQVRVTTEAEGVKVTARVFYAAPAGRTSTSAPFTRAAFEGALDKVSRPVKGKYADVPYSSEDLIRDKRTEVELEDR